MDSLYLTLKDAGMGSLGKNESVTMLEPTWVERTHAHLHTIIISVKVKMELYGKVNS